MDRPASPAASGFPVAVVIVNYRTGELVASCLASLAAQVADRPDTHVVVVDNASGDGSAERIEAAIESLGAGAWARVMRAPGNGGFGAGNNLALRALRSSGGDGQRFAAYWLLNPDTEAQPGALKALADHLRDHPGCGIVGSQLLEADGQPWPYAFRFPSVAGEFESYARLGLVTRGLRDRAVARTMDIAPGAPPQPTDWVSGASFMVREAVFEQIGLMDEGYFLYYEETDFSRRAAQAGWTSCFVPASRVLHISGQSTGVTGQQDRPRRRPDYWFESRRRYFRKTHGRAYAVAADLACMAGCALWHLARFIRRRPNTDPPGFMIDLLRHSALIRR